MKRILIFGVLMGLMVVMGGVGQIGAADTVTVTGEIVDTYCYALKGAKGDGHRQCAIDCVKKGIPAGLLEDGTNKLYVLLPKEAKSPLPDAVTEKMAKKVTVTGKTFTSGGSQFLTTESIK